MSLSMTLSAMPTSYDLSTPESNLAGEEMLYTAYDGTPIGVGRPFPNERALNGMSGPFSAADAFVAVLTGLHGFRSGGALVAAVWAFAGYLAPLPVLGVAAMETYHEGLARSRGQYPLQRRR